MPELKIAIFTGNYNHIQDGVSLTLNRLVSYLTDHGVPVMVFGPTVENPPMDHEGDFVAVPSVSALGRPEYRISTGLPKALQKRLKDFDPCLIHIATPDILGYKALKFGRSNGIPVVASYHTHFTSYLKYYKLGILEPLIWQYLRWFYRHCRQLYVPSSSMKEELNGHGIVHGLEIWARGVDTSLFNPDKRSLQWRRSAGFEDHDVVVTFVSRLVWEKDLRTFSATLNKCIPENSKIKIMVVGDGPERDEFHSLIPQALFTGYLSGESLARAYASSDIFFFPSDTETFGNVTLEAMACGLPVVVADATGSKSFVDEKVNGFIGRPQNIGQFSGYIDQLARDTSMRENMGKASRQKALDYEWDTVMEKLLKLYNQVSGEQGRKNTPM
ncbi:MAG: glycosyltransferase family 1 protein [Balneolales bacterium]